MVEHTDGQTKADKGRQRKCRIASEWAGKLAETSVVNYNEGAHIDVMPVLIEPL